MFRTSRTQRLALLTASTALAAGGSLLSSSAFAAPAAAHTAPAGVVADHNDGDRFKHKKKQKKRSKKVTETTRTTEIRKDGTVIITEKVKVTERKGLNKVNGNVNGKVNR
ncbi:hypothetical protein [Streptomyces sp. NPDC051219]|uniref:hypothetical protein n=1 Tax=Streptomyces sp. NPDC051219 TaxID=3155283 RepID=UPI00341C405A